MEYLISLSELRRRKIAYASLSTSTIVSLVIASYIFQMPVALPVYGFVGISLVILGVFAFTFFVSLKNTKIIASNSTLERRTENNADTILLKDIRKITVKWTSRHTIREIYIWAHSGKSMFLTGLDNFSAFHKELQNHIPSETQVREIHEPIDYDHPLFYPILGFLISMIGTWGFRWLMNVTNEHLKIGLRAFFVYTLVLGFYILITKPISKRTSSKSRLPDILLGGLIILSGLFILLCENVYF